MNTPRNIRWVATGEGRTGHVSSHLGGGEIRIDRRYRGRKFQVRFWGEPRGDDFPDVDAAKAFAERHILIWCDERKKAREDHLDRQRREKEELKARQERLEQVAARLQSLGVRVRYEPLLSCLPLDVQAAEELAAMLEDLRRSEERGAV